MKKLVLIIITLSIIAGCKKYPDDQNLPHLESPEGRLCRGDWVYMHIYNTITNAVVTNTIERRISFYRHKKRFEGKAPPYLNFTGTWELKNKKKNLAITDDKGNTSEYVIQQLDHDLLVF